MVTVPLRALLVPIVLGGVLALAGCGNADPRGGSGGASATVPVPTPSAVPSTQPPVPTGLPTVPNRTVPKPSGGVRPGPTGIPVGTGTPVTVEGVIEAGVEPGCRVLTAGSRMYLVLGGNDAPLGVPVVVEGVLQPGVLSTCQQGTPLRVISVKRR